MVALLEKDISQLQAVEGYAFGGILHFFGVKDMWWGKPHYTTQAIMVTYHRD